MTVCAAAALSATGCASFAEDGAAFSDAPTLTATVATVLPPDGWPTTPPPSSSGSAQGSTAPPATPDGPSGPADPCAPPQLPVVAVCLDEPWGLAPLPDGESALVGERVSGRILRVTPGRSPDLVARIGGLATAGGGGLLGIALSPYFVEDQLLYAYVTTAADARILRLAAGDEPKAIVTGLPAGPAHPAGVIAFGDDDLLYVAAADGSILRYDSFGSPAVENASGTSVFATGLADPTGICPLPGGGVGVLDHRPGGDLLLVLAEGRDYGEVRSGDALWTFSPGDGGALDCAISDSALLATVRSQPSLSRIEMRGADSFTGVPQSLLEGDFGLLRSAVTGPGDLVWLTTRNRAKDADLAAGQHPDPSDDRVIVLPPGGGGGGGDGGVD